MPFEKVIDLNYKELPLHTKYRFAEIELHKAYNQLTRFFRMSDYPTRRAAHALFTAIAPKVHQHDEFESKFEDAIKTNVFNRPNKHEYIYYLRYSGFSYRRIRDITKVSPNTLVINNRYDSRPDYYPIYPLWNEDMLEAWNESKKVLNLFDVPLEHFKNQ